MIDISTELGRDLEISGGSGFPAQGDRVYAEALELSTVLTSEEIKRGNNNLDPVWTKQQGDPESQCLARTSARDADNILVATELCLGDTTLP